MIVLRWVVRIVAISVLIAGAIAMAARVHDGPLGPFPGGALVAGTDVAEPVADWSFAATIEEIELQLASQTTSRITWVLVHDGKAYVPASTVFPPGKTWHEKALSDGRATLRIDGKKYPVTLAKVEDAGAIDALRGVAAEKYQPPPGGRDGVWFFSVTSRPGGS
jgi:hypothetical protein